MTESALPVWKRVLLATPTDRYDTYHEIATRAGVNVSTAASYLSQATRYVPIVCEHRRLALGEGGGYRRVVDEAAVHAAPSLNRVRPTAPAVAPA